MDAKLALVAQLARLMKDATNSRANADASQHLAEKLVQNVKTIIGAIHHPTVARPAIATQMAPEINNAIVKRDVACAKKAFPATNAINVPGHFSRNCRYNVTNCCTKSTAPFL